MVRESIPYGYTQASVEGGNIYNVDPADDDNADRAEKDLVRLGVVGTGGIAQGKHLPAIHRLRSVDEPVDVVAVAEPRDDLGRKVADQYRANRYADHEAMLDAEDVDAIVHTTGPSVALSILRDVVDRGIHVFREKPLAFEGLDHLDDTIDVTEAVCDLADQSDTVLMTGFCKRFSPPYAHAKRLVEDGAIGEPAMIAGKMVQSWADDGLLEMQTCHLIDLFRHFAGEVETVHATGVNRYGRTDYDVDNAVVQFEFDSGAVGTLYQNSTSPNMKPWERLEVFGDGSWLQVEDGVEVRLHDSERGPTKSWKPTVPNTLLYDEEFGGYVWELENFLDAVRGLEAPHVTGRDGLEALRIARAAHRSIDAGETVTLD